MQRDSIHLSVPRRSHSERASGQFFHLSSVVASVFVPTHKQLETLDGSYLSIGSYLTESEEFRELTIEVHGHGSRQIGTLVRPLHVREIGFDVDAVLLLKRAAMLRYGGAEGARRLINDLHRVLKRYADHHRLGIEKWDRCVTLVYVDGVRVDVAPVIEDPLVSIPSGETHALIPDRLLERYAPTNPRGLEQGFNTAAKIQAIFTRVLKEAQVLDYATRADVAPLPDPDVVSKRLLSIFVQLMKVHRNICFGAPKNDSEDLSPASIFITTLAAISYTLKAPQPHETPLDLLLDVFETMPMCFQRERRPHGDEIWALPNPWAPGDDLAACMNTPQKQAAFFQWHTRFCRDIGELLESIEQRSGSGVTEALVEKAFGPRAASAVREDSAPKAPTSHAGRSVVFGTAAGAMASLPARANTNFGSPD
ncbi:nucleotidyltransferase [Polaromonas sp. JS666]|uniref:nucleotidyltransferase domain-containing protein n=1 Tax=Polaromonas sp. (strain JS666 / ATCC BAA-500) TaxID=296591 RepID=UPI0008859CF5|nr:nucleotidyltransferase [Polaromonas sp. JS666]SDM44097.1 hypothetical protein SAMN05720382_101361 [Polaromonas sp. JS666]